MTVGEAETGLVAADVLATPRCLDQRWLVDACHIVKTVGVSICR